MNWKKLLLIGLIALGFGFASTPSQAGVSVGIVRVPVFIGGTATGYL